jgi:hypothetical protein
MLTLENNHLTRYGGTQIIAVRARFKTPANRVQRPAIHRRVGEGGGKGEAKRSRKTQSMKSSQSPSACRSQDRTAHL